MHERAADEKFCTECGSVIRRRAEICPKCGVRQMAPPTRSSRSKLAAGLLGIFFGGIGLHKFYLGQGGWGFLYLLFCWTLIPMLFGFLEGIHLLAISDEEFEARFGTTR